ncbi:uncharacterized protein BT62DRAFT_927549 [Guyanagaster necrorhizus]|uniref:Uncharacterized protein n=1 Tax=Guyanagaster necrorhizus TaxID=856835 RepID=A0A9P7W0Z8_9AGAR|nr:uncharacterized protein BT62DRAFT_927549 [Guyanagaster necrorhizus MCA 3950]KAG7450233.1 hypothetical protein BT62DRAFT_927549 [Guyanagaster necrorhizus MCA 3950]
MPFLSGRGYTSELKVVQLNTAIAYLQAVKETFHDQPAVYTHFSALLQNSSVIIHTLVSFRDRQLFAK